MLSKLSWSMLRPRIRRFTRRLRERWAARRTPLGRALKPPTRMKSAEANVSFCETALRVLGNPDSRKEILEGKVPLNLKRYGFELAMMEIMVEVTPDRKLLEMGIWLPDRSFLMKGNKLLKLALYYGYWKHGPYFMPLHAAVELASKYASRKTGKAMGQRVGRLLKESFYDDGKLRVTEKELDGLAREFSQELERNRRILRFIGFKGRKGKGQ